MTIEPTNSSAIQLAHQLLEQYAHESPWLREFEEEIDTARARYTQENDDIDRRNEYPNQEFLEERYRIWSETIETFREKQIRVCSLATTMNQDLVRLRRCSIPLEIFQKIRFINHVESQLLEQYYTYLRAKVSALEERHDSIQTLATKALGEINCIEGHPHRRLRQTIARVTGGQRTSSSLSWATDKASRHLSSAYSSLVGMPTPLRLRSFSSTEPLPSQRSDESEQAPELVPPPKNSLPPAADQAPATEQPPAESKKGAKKR